MAENTTRPPTPVGWSDTDWIKHLQEQKESHPLAGLHINQGSMDAAADAYEAEYYAARRGGRTLDVVTLTGGEYDALCYEIEDLRNILRKLVEHDVTYWDNKGEVRHDVGASQSEAMAIFREARQLLTPNLNSTTPNPSANPTACPPTCQTQPGKPRHD